MNATKHEQHYADATTAKMNATGTRQTMSNPKHVREGLAAQLGTAEHHYLDTGEGHKASVMHHAAHEIYTLGVSLEKAEAFIERNKVQLNKLIERCMKAEAALREIRQDTVNCREFGDSLDPEYVYSVANEALEADDE